MIIKISLFEFMVMYSTLRGSLKIYDLNNGYFGFSTKTREKVIATINKISMEKEIELEVGKCQH